MQQGNAIEVKNITKKFKVYYDKGSQLKERLLFKNRNRYEERKVLNDISFDVKKGEAIGLIGQNGCGKSTTLKLLTRIIYPDSGSVEMSGRVSSLIELGAGFHPDMSGRENIYTNAAIFGLTKKEIDARVDDIIEFSELAAFIDNPVRTYSSGMYMRLAFSVAINVDADILLIDEILAVGDAAFQAKCFNRLREIKAAGTTIVIVSHSTGQIEQICDRAIWIKDGKIEREGIPRNVIQVYMSWIMGDDEAKLSNNIKDEERTKRERKQSNEKKTENIKENGQGESYEYTLQDILNIKQSGKYAEIGNHAVEITDYELLDAKTLKHKIRFGIGEDILCRVFYERKDKKLTETMFSLAIYRSDGLNCYSTNCFINTGKNIVLRDEGAIEFLIKENPFMQGEYKMDLSLNKDYGPTYHGIINACTFEVYNITTDYGVCRPKIEWNLDSREEQIRLEDLTRENLEEKLGLNSSLEIEFESLENADNLFLKDYDLIIIKDGFSDLETQKNVIRTAVEHTKYLLVEKAGHFNFETKIQNCVMFENRDVKDCLIFVSTKNKELVTDALDELKEEFEQKWLLDCFNEQILEFTVDVEKIQKLNDSESLVSVNLLNKSGKSIQLLDDGIAFAYRIYSEEGMQEGTRLELRKKLYPGKNLHDLKIDTSMGSRIELSIVKEGEYWLDERIPECKAVINL